MSTYSRSLTVAAVVTGVILVPILLTNYMPYFRTLRPPLKPLPLPHGVSRLTTPEGLELLVAKPEENQSSTQPNSAPLLLIHGGYGTAHCFSKWLPYLARHGHVAYSLSLTGMSPMHFSLSNIDIEKAMDNLLVRITLSTSPSPTLHATPNAH